MEQRKGRVITYRNFGTSRRAYVHDVASNGVTGHAAYVCYPVDRAGQPKTAEATFYVYPSEVTR